MAGGWRWRVPLAGAHCTLLAGAVRGAPRWRAIGDSRRTVSGAVCARSFVLQGSAPQGCNSAAALVFALVGGECGADAET